MKKRLRIFTLFCILILCFAQISCFEGKEHDGKISIITTVFPAYDFAKQIVGQASNISVTMLLPPGTESHSYEPSPKDIINIQKCDLFIYVGGESESWVEKIIKSLDRKPMILKLVDCVPFNDNHEKSEKHDHNDYDEHVWTSITNAILITEKIKDAICKIDEENKEKYNENCSLYCKKLSKLKDDFSQMLETKENKLLVFGDRFPFKYFAEEFGLNYLAAFPGCSAETEPDAATIARIIDTINEKKIKAVFHIEFSNKNIAKILSDETGCEIRLFHSCHNVTEEEIAAGVSYISLMTENLNTLKEVL